MHKRRLVMVHVGRCHLIAIMAAFFVVGVVFAWIIRQSHSTLQTTNLVTDTSLGDASYAILAANDLGMHCIQPDYSPFFILPPANNLRVQIFDKNHEGKPVTQGIMVEYALKNNTTSADKTNFWQYAADYGYNLKPNVGITNNSLSGRMQLDATGRFWEATAIPVVPYNDDPTLVNAYQIAVITVRNSSTGAVVAQLDNVVLPVSDEMNCGNCHGSTETGMKILNAHDRYESTTLSADLARGVRHRCNECHADPILDAPGQAGVPSLSLAMHGFHADKMQMSSSEVVCYNCHPGTVTQCNRGVMYKEGILCDNPRCHGSMAQVAQSIRNGRTPWLEEPGCANKGCHSAAYAPNSSRLYRNSYLQNAPNRDMNNQILCESCHNGTHAEWPSTKSVDNLVPLQVQGKASFISKCTVCHENGSGRVHRN